MKRYLAAVIAVIFIQIVVGDIATAGRGGGLGNKGTIRKNHAPPQVKIESKLGNNATISPPKLSRREIESNWGDESTISPRRSQLLRHSLPRSILFSTGVNNVGLDLGIELPPGGSGSPVEEMTPSRAGIELPEEVSELVTQIKSYLSENNTNLPQQLTSGDTWSLSFGLAIDHETLLYRMITTESAP